jgi:hypothetical protein
MESFSEVVKLCSRLNDFKQPWFVAGGWAIDLFIGDVTINFEVESKTL